MRDTVVLGRSGQVGGRLRSVTDVRRAGRPVLLEDQRLDPDRLRSAPGLLGPHRVLDTAMWLGVVRPPVVAATTYALVDGAGSLSRWLGDGLADSPLHGVDPEPVVRPEPASPADDADHCVALRQAQGAFLRPGVDARTLTVRGLRRLRERSSSLDDRPRDAPEPVEGPRRGQRPRTGEAGPSRPTSSVRLAIRPSGGSTWRPSRSRCRACRPAARAARTSRS